MFTLVSRISKIRLNAMAPVQADGEPWRQRPANIRISLVDQAPVLVNRQRGTVSATTSPSKLAH